MSERVCVGGLLLWGDAVVVRRDDHGAARGRAFSRLARRSLPAGHCQHPGKAHNGLVR